MIHCNFILRGHLLFTWKTHCGLKFQSIWPKWNCTKVSFTTHEVMWTLTMKLPHTEVKFYTKVKSCNHVNVLLDYYWLPGYFYLLVHVIVIDLVWVTCLLQSIRDCFRTSFKIIKKLLLHLNIGGHGDH